MAKTQTTPRPQKSSAKAKAAVNKMKGAATKATPPSDESGKMKAKKKTVVGKDSEVERQKPSCSAKSNVDKKSGDDDIPVTHSDTSQCGPVDHSNNSQCGPVNLSNYYCQYVRANYNDN
jgi:hypothetical protein